MRSLTMCAVISAAIIPFFVSSAQAAVLSTILDYKFEQGPAGAAVTTVTDSGPYHLDGVATGPLTYSSDVAKGGGKFSLNATGDVDYIYQTPPNPSLLDQLSNFTLSVLAKPEGGSSTDYVGDMIAGKVASNGFGPCLVTYGIFYSVVSRKFIGLVCDASETVYYVSSTDTYPFDAWHSVVFSFTTPAIGTTTTLKLVVDGVNEGVVRVKGLAGNLLTGASAFQVGASNFGYSETGINRRNFISFIDNVVLKGQPH